MQYIPIVFTIHKCPREYSMLNLFSLFVRLIRPRTHRRQNGEIKEGRRQLWATLSYKAIVGRCRRSRPNHNSILNKKTHKRTHTYIQTYIEIVNLIWQEKFIRLNRRVKRKSKVNDAKTGTNRKKRVRVTRWKENGRFADTVCPRLCPIWKKSVAHSCIKQPRLDRKILSTFLGKFVSFL